MAYTALYRSYRPQSFKEVAGQEHITKTFLNALKNDKIAHAYLFSGPRGTGKTTIAKIIAKAVNCLKNDGHGDPCNECDVCKGINNGTIGDVIEIDAASNNGVDEIREIRDKVKYLPSVGKYKVYIIDEVHMLSIGAFNALLKTLEEPPKHVIFILATTEPYKIPSTIISRCQRFDFRGIAVSDIISRMKEIVLKEKINIDDEAIRVIAESAEGGMRDALSLLDQAISYGGDTVTVNDVHMVNGSVSTNSLLELATRIAAKDSVKALEILDELVSDGKEVPRILSDLIQFYRDMLVYRNTKDKVESKGIFTNEIFIKMSTEVTNAWIYKIMDILNETQNNVKWTNQKKVYLELALIKMSDDEEMKDFIIEERLAKLEKRLADMEKNKTKGTEIVHIVDKPVVENDVIAVIENVLNYGDKDKKALLRGAWSHLENVDDPAKANIARTLQRGELVAINNDTMIITYPDAASCKVMMKDGSKNIVKQILNRKTKWIEDYIAITDAKWQEIINEYMEQFRQGIKNPKLGNISIDIDTTEVVVAGVKRETIADVAGELFGKDKITSVEE